MTMEAGNHSSTITPLGKWTQTMHKHRALSGQRDNKTSRDAPTIATTQKASLSTRSNARAIPAEDSKGVRTGSNRRG